MTSIWVTLECAGNKRALMTPQTPGTPWGQGAVGTAEWTGVPLQLVLAKAGVTSRAVEVQFTGADTGRFSETGQWVHFERSLPLGKALHPHTLLAVAMNGEALPWEHGGPVRLIVPGWYAMASVKWLTRLVVRSKPFRGPFQVRDYVYAPAPGADQRSLPVTLIRVNSAITFPWQGVRLRPGHTVVRGLAWSGEEPVQQVDVSVGGEPWQTATLIGPESQYAWRLWHHRVALPRQGQYQLLARATDASGHTQPPEAPWNAKGYGNNQVSSVTVTVSYRGGPQRDTQP